MDHLVVLSPGYKIAGSLRPRKSGNSIEQNDNIAAIKWHVENTVESGRSMGNVTTASEYQKELEKPNNGHLRSVSTARYYP